MSERVDILVANYNTLPWLKLLVSQAERLRPKIPADFIVWDNASQDGSSAWLASKTIRHHVNPVSEAHYIGLIGALRLSSAPYVAFMDVDAFPIKEGWLDEAVNAIRDQHVGAAGLWLHIAWAGRREFVHPSFCVFRRDLYDALALDPSIADGITFTWDVGERMCAQIENAGYHLKFLGRATCKPEDVETLGNKVLHAGGAAGVLGNASWPADWVKANTIAHRILLLKLGLWGEFVGYLRESAEQNPLCARYYTCDGSIPSWVKTK